MAHLVYAAHESHIAEQFESAFFFFEGKLRRLLRSGADINQLLFAQRTHMSTWHRFDRRVQMERYDLSAALRWLCLPNGLEPDHLSIVRFVNLLVQNGHAYFYRQRSDLPLSVFAADNAVGKSLYDFLVYLLREGLRSSTFLPIARGIAHQFLALGYGRRELHSSAGLKVAHDENLQLTRFLAEHERRFNQNVKDELKSLVDYFDAGPLSLQQLVRIAIRRAVGGVCFERRMRAIAHLLPPLLYKYVANAEEIHGSFAEDTTADLMDDLLDLENDVL